MANEGRLRVAVVGAGSWAQRAHIPGWQRDPRVQVVALADVAPEPLAAAAEKFSVARTATDYRELLDDPDIDVIDVVTGNRPHFQVSWDALQAGKHVLCEKPVHNDYLQTRRAADLAKAKGLKTKLGFTFRYAPAVLYAKELIDAGFVGEPYIFNGYEQNSQWLDPSTPLRQFDPEDDPAQIAVSSIEGYGAPIIDIMHWWLDAPMTSVVGTMRNFVPSRILRDTGQMTRVNIDDGDMWIAEFGSGAIASIQSSYVTVGNYPGIEARIYGSEGAIIVRLVDEFGICETIKTAKKETVEFTEQQVPNRGSSSSTPTWSMTSPRRSSATSPVRGTSRRARWSRRRSTRSRRRSASAPGSASRSAKPTPPAPAARWPPHEDRHQRVRADHPDPHRRGVAPAE